MTAREGSTVAGCGVCQCEILDGEAAQACPACAAVFHVDCWEYNRGCAVYGCAAAPLVEPLQPLDVVPAYWGREHKPCPACGREILSGAIRCRHCGAQFPTVRPQSAEESRLWQQRAERMPRLRRGATLLLVFGLLPVTAPLAAAGGALWYARNRDLLRRLTGIAAASWRIGLGVAIAQTALLVFLVILHPVLRGS